jgi:hypothetical protein
VPGQVAVKASGGVSKRPPIKGCNGVAVDGLGQACRFLASFGLPFALHGYANEETAMRHHALLPQKFRWHRYGKPEVRADSRKAGPFIQAIVSFVCAWIPKAFCCAWLSQVFCKLMPGYPRSCT